MNEIISAIYKRRSVRKYKDVIVSKEQIDELLDAGRMAPSAMNQQVWRFYVVTDKEKIKLFSQEIIKEGIKEGIKSVPKMGIKKIARAFVSGITHLAEGIDFMKADDPVFHGAPVVIFITAPNDNEWAALDIGMCVQNILLAATSLGLDTCPIGFGKFVEHTKHYPDLQIPTNEKVQLAIIIGYGDETPPIHDRKKDNVFYR